MGKFVGTDFDTGMKFGHDFLKIQWLVNVDQQRVFDLEESVWTDQEKKNRLRFRIYWTKTSVIDPFAPASSFDAVFEIKNISPRYWAYRTPTALIDLGIR
jgi:hypothetical protein